MTFLQTLSKAVQPSLRQIIPSHTLVDGDRIIYRKHWAILLRTALIPLIMLVIDIFFWSAFPIYHIISALSVGSWLRWVVIGLSCIPAPFLWWRYENWRNDYYIVTDDRLMDVEKLPLGMRTEVLEAPIANVQNVSMEIPGILAASLGYGNVNIETAGRQGRLTFASVANPRRVMQEISARLDAHRAKIEERVQERREEEMTDWFSAFQALPRVVMVKNPPLAKAGEPFDVEWRVDGPPGDLETTLYWDARSRQDPSYRYSLPPQQGGAGNYTGTVFAPLAERTYLRIRAVWKKGEHWSDEYEVPLEGFRIELPRAIPSGAAVEIRWRLQARPQAMTMCWDTRSHEDGAYAHRERVDPERAGYACRLMVPPARAIYLRLEAVYDEKALASDEFVIPVVTSLSS